MPSHNDIPAVALQVSRDVLVASIQVDLEQQVLQRFRQDLLHRLQAGAARAAVLDLSGLDTIDAHEFNGLRQIMKACEVMGAPAVLVGLRPGMVSSLVDAGVEADGIRTALDLDRAFALLDAELSRDAAAPANGGATV
jgi:anti-anti-sigma regulatory factor